MNIDGAGPAQQGVACFRVDLRAARHRGDEDRRISLGKSFFQPTLAFLGQTGRIGQCFRRQHDADRQPKNSGGQAMTRSRLRHSDLHMRSEHPIIRQMSLHPLSASRINLDAPPLSQLGDFGKNLFIKRPKPNPAGSTGSQLASDAERGW